MQQEPDMNATRHLTPATLLVATLAAVTLLQAPAARAAQPQAEIVQLPTVHVIARRAAPAAAAVVVLPTVHVVAKRQPTLLAQKATRAAAL
jgi:hypothetical protein